MHRTEHCDRERRTLRLSASQRVFSPPAGSLRSGTPRASFDQGRLLVTAFRSPVTAAPSRSLHPKVNVPGLLLRNLAHVCTARSDFRSATATGSPRSAATSSRNPVAAPARASNGCSRGLHSPSGLLHPSGSTRSTASAATRPAFRIRPISARSPKPVLFLGSASDHRSWSATFPVAC